MRKLIVCNIVSLDGFYSGPGGNVMAMPFDDGFSDYNAERLRAADTLLLGRKSYEGFRSYWPAIAEDVSQPAVEREISRLNAAIEKVVVSNGLKPDEVEGWGPTRVVRRADAYAEVAALKERSGREILMFGSHLLWNDLLANGLVDELALHDRCRRGRRGRAGFRDPAARLAPPAGHPHLRRLEPAPGPVRRRALTAMPRPTAEPGAAADGGGHLGFWDFKLTVAPAAAELGR
jgi:dihydrofolate reductase